MGTLSQQDRDDAYGPRLVGGRLAVPVIALVLSLGFLLLAVLSGEAPWAIIAAPAASVAGLTAYCGWMVRSRRVRLRALSCGVLCPSRLLSKDVKVYTGHKFPFEPEYWVTVRYSVGGIERTVRVQVTDRVYYRASRSRPLWGRVLPSRPTLWVPDSAASAGATTAVAD